MDEHLLRFDKDKIYTYIDFETENLCLNGNQNLPWQTGMIKVKGDKKVDEKDYKMKWPRDINVSAEAARITRFRHENYIKVAQPVEELFPTIEDWLENCDYIVGHNILGFDIYFIKELYQLLGKKYEHLVHKIIDTNCIARGIKMGKPYTPNTSLVEYQYKIYHTKKRGIKSSLIALGKEFEINHDYDKLHDAVVDLELNLKIWNKLKWQVEI